MTPPSATPPRGIKEGVAVVGGILFSAAVGFLYQKLTELHIGSGVFTYSLSYTIPVVLCAAGVYLAAALQIRRIALRRAVPQELEEEMPDSGEARYVSEDSFEAACPLPEKEEKTDPDPVTDAAVQRAEKIAAALAAQRMEEAAFADQEETPLGEEDIWDTFYKASPSSSEDTAEDFYADLPSELPEGYTLPDQDLEEEEEISFMEEEAIVEETVSRHLIWNFVPVVCALLLLMGVLWICTFCWTGAGADGLYTARMGSVWHYSWDQVESYTVDAAFSSGEMRLYFQMTDGRQVKVSPESYAQKKTFADQYENLYAYWLHVDNILGVLDIEKTVTQKEYLADTYRSREDGSWQYVQQLIGYKEDPLAQS